MKVVNGSTPLWTNTCAYDAASRLSAVSDGLNSATYTYIANSPLVGQIAFKQSSTARMTTTQQYDFLDRLTSISSAPSGGSPISFAYGYNTADQRTNCTTGDGPHWAYAYDGLGQVTNGTKYWWDNSRVPGEQFGYQFDDIGNRVFTLTGTNASGVWRSNNYTANNVNQYTSRMVTNSFDVIGLANYQATVTVNGNNADYRRGEFYQKSLTVTNTGAPVYLAVTNTATNAGSTSNVIGNYFLAQSPESFTYDSDGNLTSDGRFNYTWDAENRLVTASSIASIPAAQQLIVSNTYDYAGRRIQKVVQTNNGSGKIGRAHV